MFFSGFVKRWFRGLFAHSRYGQLAYIWQFKIKW